MKPSADSNNSKLQNEENKKIEEKRSRATRNIFLIRHGQYNLKGETDEERKLTDLGMLYLHINIIKYEINCELLIHYK